MAIVGIKNLGQLGVRKFIRATEPVSYLSSARQRMKDFITESYRVEDALNGIKNENAAANQMLDMREKLIKALNLSIEEIEALRNMAKQADGFSLDIYLRRVEEILNDGEFFQSVKTTSENADNVLFDPVKLERICKNLENQGVAIWIGEDAERFLKQMGAEAMYWDNLPGKPGTLVFPRNPTRAQVIEELKHLGQHRQRLWMEAGSYANVVEIEIKTQQELLSFARQHNWTATEIQKLEDSLDYWLNELKTIEK